MFFYWAQTLHSLQLIGIHLKAKRNQGLVCFGCEFTHNLCSHWLPLVFLYIHSSAVQIYHLKLLLDIARVRTPQSPKPFSTKSIEESTSFRLVLFVHQQMAHNARFWVKWISKWARDNIPLEIDINPANCKVNARMVKGVCVLMTLVYWDILAWCGNGVLVAMVRVARIEGGGWTQWSPHRFSNCLCASNEPRHCDQIN